ncbi:Pyruvate-flavodoxin oxidoreductase 1 [Spironucleus salmonicida]|uniref:Pyruvate-flavodoxin oxidoreductase 1 n=1 Tax=Spironucleus salmonicida TaxID=348837 RepID=K7RUJ9_9EUKA|nr:pyruvate-flavodoxin oxidoreductase 1 [Spironucleus salmonicida]KAH0575434.1 Pyruvate-flavodoxin oxidoreductase 1 [Spironucleus salmonicida]|eukprot:EST47643.1 Pyruvate-flavodoxin oxidoreductase 1 [Spironucleus salmonicida]
MTNQVCLDGNTAVAMACHKFINFSCTFPITPSSTMAELVEQYAAQGKKNLLGEDIVVKQAQSELGAIGTCHGALVTGALTATFSSSQGLLLMISNLYKIGGEKAPFVVHIANRSVGQTTTSLATDHTDIYAIEGTNLSVVQSANVQEAYDMAVCAHAASISARRAVAHSFEGYRVSHQLESLEIMTDDQLSQFIDYQSLMDWKNKSVASTDRPYAQNVGLGGEVAMQLLESQKHDINKVCQKFEKYFTLLKQLTGRSYHCYEYYGDANPETVYVLMGSSTGTAINAVTELNKSGVKCGVVKIRVFRPFDVKMFSDAIPKSTKVIVALDRAGELVQTGGTIYREVCAAMIQMNRIKSIEVVTGGRYGYLGKELMPKDILSLSEIFGSKNYGTMPKQFTVGIKDNLTNLSITDSPNSANFELKMLSDLVSQTLLYGIGSDGTIGAARNAVQILKNTADNVQVQCQFQFDGKKSGGLTMSHIRLYKGDDKEIQKSLHNAQYDIQAAQYIGCHCETYLNRYKTMMQQLKPNGVVVLNVDNKGDLLEYANKLPAQLKHDIAEKNGKLYMVNANKVSIDCGIPGRTNNILLLFYFKFGMTQLIKFEDAVEAMKDAARKTYVKAGQKVIDNNINAIDATVKLIDQCYVNYDVKEWLNSNISISGNEKINDYCPDYDKFMTTVLDPSFRREFDHITTKTMHEYNGGFFPPGYGAYEKQTSAVKVPKWNSQNCIQCSICASACSHSSIRPFILTENDSPPEGFQSIELKGKHEYGNGARYSIQVSAADCRGCNVCVKACPKQCLEMSDVQEELKKQQQFEWARSNLYKNTENVDGKKAPLKDLMTKNHYIEYAGSCPGCPESTMLKILTQISGEAMQVSVGVGCSLVWGQYSMMRPNTIDRHGRGISSISSLFEDGSVFHWGSVIGRNNVRSQIKQFLVDNIENITWDKNVQEITRGVLEHFDDPSQSYKHATELRKALKIDNFHIGDKNDMIFPGSLTDEQIKLSPKEEAELSQLLQKKVKLTESTFLTYVKLNNLLLSAHNNWFYAGDGAVFDIDFNGVDHILAKGDNVNLLVFCNQVFANTGGQLSKNSFLGQVTKNAYNGVSAPEKQLGLMMISAYGKHIYVAQVSFGFNRQQTISALREAEAFNGPSIVLCYSPCISHLIDGGLQNVEVQQKLAVESGVWPLFRWNGGAEKGQRLKIDGKKKIGVDEFICNEQRFMSLKSRNNARFEMLKGQLESNVAEVQERMEALKVM